MRIKIPEWLENLADINYSPIYIVGGYVRNQLCDLPNSDIDIAGQARLLGRYGSGIGSGSGWSSAPITLNGGTVFVYSSGNGA